MFDKYEELNISAKECLVKELENNFYKKYKEKELLDRCYKEIDILYDKSLLFIIEYLYKFKNVNKKVSYNFRGTINNLLLLYILDISRVDPIKYNLPYELFTDKTINVDLMNCLKGDLVDYLDKCNSDFKIVLGSHEKEEITEIDGLVDNHYLLIPSSATPEDMLLKINPKYFIIETLEDYREYKDIYLTLRIDEKHFIKNCKHVGLENVITNGFEYEIAKLLNPETIDDYIKIKNISHGADVWLNNQEKLFGEGKIDINNLIASREDVLEYLLSHSIDRKTALEITNCIRVGYKKTPDIWNKYVDIMKKHNCDEMFIEIFSKISFIFGRGQAVSECLFALDEANYADLVSNKNN